MIASAPDQLHWCALCRGGELETAVRVSNQFPFIQNTTSSGLESEYDFFQGSLTHQSDVGPPHQPASSESEFQPFKLVSVEQEMVELQSKYKALEAKNMVLEKENNTLRY